MFECKVCGTEIPDGATECPNCKVCQEPPAKYAPGTLVRLVLKDDNKAYYNYVTDSYFNQHIQMRMYRLNERIAMPIWREDWLEPVSAEELDYINHSDRLVARSNGGWEHPLRGLGVTK